MLLCCMKTLWWCAVLRCLRCPVLCCAACLCTAVCAVPCCAVLCFAVLTSSLHVRHCLLPSLLSAHAGPKLATLQGRSQLQADLLYQAAKICKATRKPSPYLNSQISASTQWPKSWLSSRVSSARPDCFTQPYDLIRANPTES